MEQNIAYMSQQFESADFTFLEEQKRKLYTFYEMLIEKNKVMNLTGITEFPEVVEKHFLDSIMLGKYISLEQNLRVMDLGTGAGFPGIPLKIAYPDLEITLADSLNKRIRFLDEVIEELQLTGIHTVHGRAEELARNKAYREQYDLCVSRAVANLSTLMEYCIPFVNKGGRFVSYKSGEVEEEVNNASRACGLLGGKVEQIYRFALKNGGRSFVVVKKEKQTPALYPRKAGTPSRMPL